MIREILNGEFMDCRKVREACRKAGIGRSAMRSLKHDEGIKTVEVVNGDGERMWLWFDPQQIWEKYHEREAD